MHPPLQAVNTANAQLETPGSALLTNMSKKDHSLFCKGSAYYEHWQCQAKIADRHCGGKDPRGNRWHPHTIAWALRLYNMSRSGYDHTSKIMHLPSGRTIQRYKQWNAELPGVNKDFLLHFSSEFGDVDSKKKYEKSVCLARARSCETSYKGWHTSASQFCRSSPLRHFDRLKV